MASFLTSTRMVFWTIKVGGNDRSKELSPYVSSIRIRNTILPPSQHSKTTEKGKSPTQAEINITSINYIEDIFNEGVSIDVFLGYDRIDQEHVFSGKIRDLPSGKAREMLDYTVIAYAHETEMDLVQKSRILKGSKEKIIEQIAVENDFYFNISIMDKSAISPSYAITQKEETDLQFLHKCAKQWNCLLWFWPPYKPQTLYFVDAKSAHSYNKPISLGYRTDAPGIKNNVESIEWSHDVARAATELNPGVFGFNEAGVVESEGSFEWIDEKRRNVTWELQPKYMALYKQNKGEFYSWWKDMTAITRERDVFAGIRKYFVIVKYAENTSPNVPPQHDDSGMKIVVHLNEGDQTIYPPMSIHLYCGSLNPRADSSYLPSWLFQYGSKTRNYEAVLKLNEHNLSFEQGMLRSELICSMGMLA